MTPLRLRQVSASGLALLVLLVPASASAARPGSPDPTFGGDGYVSIRLPEGGDPIANDLLRRPGGHAVIATSDELEGVGFVLRTTATGRIDRSFGAGGYVRRLAGTTFSAQALAAGPTGSILVAGDVGGDLMVARLTADGRPDPSFAEDGVYTGPPGEARSLAVLPNGDVVAGGSLLPSSRGGGTRLMLVRLDASGRPVPGFGSGGTVVSDENGYRNGLDVLALAAEPGGGFVADIALDTCLPRAACRTAIRRHRADGSVDPGFGANGTVELGFRTHMPALLRRPSGSYLLAGAGPSSARGDREDASLAALSPAGTPRQLSAPRFAVSRGRADGFADLLRKPDGKLVAVGYAGDRLLVARFTAGGRPDRAFSQDGFALLRARRAFYASADSVERVSGGRLLIAGQVDNGLVLLRLHG